MLLRIITVVAKGYGLLLSIAIGGLVGANFAGLISTFFAFASNAHHPPGHQFIKSWVHVGWVVGAVLCFAGEVARQVKSKKKKREIQRRRLPNEPNKGKHRGFEVRIGSRRCGILGSFAIGGLLGGFLGLMLGGTFLMIWFSSVYSPFAVEEWVASVQVQRRVDGSGTAQIASTKHPVALIAFLGPIALGATAGAVCGAVGTAVEKFRTAKENIVRD